MNKFVVGLVAALIASPVIAEEKVEYTPAMIEECSTEGNTSDCLKDIFLAHMFLDMAEELYGDAGTKLVNICRTVNDNDTKGVVSCFSNAAEDAHKLKDMIGVYNIKDVCKQGIARQDNHLDGMEETVKNHPLNRSEMNGRKLSAEIYGYVYHPATKACMELSQEKAEAVLVEMESLYCREANRVQEHFKTASAKTIAKELDEHIKQIKDDNYQGWSDQDGPDTLALYYLKEKHQDQWINFLTAVLSQSLTEEDLKEDPEVFAARVDFVEGIFILKADREFEKFSQECAN